MNIPFVVVIQADSDTITYPECAPYSPSVPYPEYPFGHLAKSHNLIYAMVRNLFYALGLDAQNFGTPKWNPLGDLIQPGETVLVKPNMVLHSHKAEGDIYSVITHGSVIRAVLDYVIIALNGTGRAVVGDSPLQSANFDQIMDLNGLRGIQRFYREQGIKVDVVDFRLEHAIVDDSYYIIRKGKSSGDPLGYYVVDLGADSLLTPLRGRYRLYRVTNYDPYAMIKHHNEERNQYLIPASVLEADVVINIPKLKTHCKAGMTASLKNLVGINGQKDWLPHHRRGSIPEGGDEYLYRNAFKKLAADIVEIEDVQTNLAIKKFFRAFRLVATVIAKLMEKDSYTEGSWYGNDTLWRTILDLNRILFYADKSGSMQATVQRRYLSIVDAITAGEGEGPLEPTAKTIGAILGGFNPVAVDAVAARLMGFDYRKIPCIREGFSRFSYPLAIFSPDEIRVRSNNPRWDGLVLHDGKGGSWEFTPPKGWKGHIELEWV
jgi:uncharacterized protein (DUF362 family)